MFNDSIWQDIAKGIAGVLVAVFLPKRIFLCIREFILFCFNAVINSWAIAVLFSIGFIALYYWFPYELNEKIYFSIVFLSIISACIIAELQNIYYVLKSKNSLIIYGCFSTRDKEYLIVDIDADGINDTLRKLSEELKKAHFVFREKIIHLKFISLPKFIPLLLGYKAIQKLFEKFIKNNQHISSIYFIRDISGEELVTVLNFNSINFVNGELIKDVQILLNEISRDNRFDLRTVGAINLKIFALIFSQTFLDYILAEKKYTDAQLIVDEQNQLLNELNDTINGGQNNTPGFTQFYNIWKSYIDRYRAILLLEQNEIRGAATYLISSIKLNPHYPYFNYSTFKDNYTKRYGIELSYSIQEFSNEMESNSGVDFGTIRANISKNIIAKDAIYNHSLLLDVIRKDEKGVTYKYIEQELSKLPNDNIPIMLIKAEVLKYLPDGTDKINEIYSGRINEVVELLEKIVEIDNSFTVVQSKIGALLMNKAFSNGNEQEIQTAIEKWTYGMHFLTELGFPIHSNTSNNNSGV